MGTFVNALWINIYRSIGNRFARLVSAEIDLKTFKNSLPHLTTLSKLAVLCRRETPGSQNSTLDGSFKKLSLSDTHVVRPIARSYTSEHLVWFKKAVFLPCGKFYCAQSATIMNFPWVMQLTSPWCFFF